MNPACASIRAIAALLVMVCACHALAADDIDITAPALFEGRAMLIVNGKQVLLEAGQTGPEGVELISSSSKQAVVRINGKERLIKPGGKIKNTYKSAGKRSISLTPGDGGHYVVGGSINGNAVQFLVDTGATNIVLNSTEAKRMGLRYSEGVRGKMSTASGIVDTFQIILKRVRIGDLEELNVVANVTTGSFPPVLLLGNSFLGRMDIVRKGEIMTITER